MLLLQCYVGDHRFVLDGDWVIEVVPWIHLKPLPHSPPYLIGLMNFNNEPVPVIDFCQIVAERACVNSLHTRIVLLKNPKKEGPSSHLFGLLAEKITETVDLEKSVFLDSGIKIAHLPFYGGIMTEGELSIQWVNLEELSHYLQGQVFK